MCGITGFLNLRNKPVNPYKIKPMCDIIKHRGPDDAGYFFVSTADRKTKRKNIWLELTDNQFKYKNVNLAPIESDFARNELDKNKWNLVFGHRRLSIIDLSHRGHQPMSDRSKSVWVVHNGEIYNFNNIRKKLEKKGYSFYSNTDTEVIIHAYNEWGIDCVKEFNGMFAFALWDNIKNCFFIARDRHGVIPVYYYRNKNIFIFGSEIKSIIESKYLKTDLDPFAMNEYFTFQNVFSDRTLFKDIKILPSGSYIEIDLGAEKVTGPCKYWDFKFDHHSYTYSEKDTIDKIYELFKRSVSRQLISDVPVGSYLSGGMDSGSVVAIASKHFGRISTFSCGFDMSSASGLEMSYDERREAEILANLFKTEHYESVLHAGDMEAILPELIWHLEDLRVGQCYPNYYISRLAGKFVKVVLSGGGGDELFGGYPWRYYRVLKPTCKEDFFISYYNYWQRLVDDKDKPAFFNKINYSHIKDYNTFDVFRSVFKMSNETNSIEDYINESMYFEIKTFLHGVLVVENKISMAHSLETRVPFLDNDLVDLAMKIPPRYKLRTLDKIEKLDEDEIGKLKTYFKKTNDGKIILRKAMQKLIPKVTIDRVKQGFSAPDASWFKGESIDYIKSLILNKNARIYEHLNYKYVNRRINEHLSGKVNHRLFIWSLLSFEWWLRKFLK